MAQPRASKHAAVLGGRGWGWGRGVGWEAAPRAVPSRFPSCRQLGLAWVTPVAPRQVLFLRAFPPPGLLGSIAHVLPSPCPPRVNRRFGRHLGSHPAEHAATATTTSTVPMPPEAAGDPTGSGSGSGRWALQAVRALDEATAAALLAALMQQQHQQQ